MDKVIRDAKDYRFWVELFGLAILFIARWPFTPLWKKRKFDYDSQNPIPKSEVSYWSLCALGALTDETSSARTNATSTDDQQEED